jgi:hypothetical protein
MDRGYRVCITLFQAGKKGRLRRAGLWKSPLKKERNRKECKNEDPNVHGSFSDIMNRNLKGMRDTHGQERMGEGDS